MIKRLHAETALRHTQFPNNAFANSNVNLLSGHPIKVPISLKNDFSKEKKGEKNFVRKKNYVLACCALS